MWLHSIFYDNFSIEGFDAFEFGTSCLQSVPAEFEHILNLDMFAPKTPLSEDCLTLNLWVPHPKQDRRSVMVCRPYVYVRVRIHVYVYVCVCVCVYVCMYVHVRMYVCMCMGVLCMNVCMCACPGNIVVVYYHLTTTSNKFKGHIFT